MVVVTVERIGGPATVLLQPRSFKGTGRASKAIKCFQDLMMAPQKLCENSFQGDDIRAT